MSAILAQALELSVSKTLQLCSYTPCSKMEQNKAVASGSQASGTYGPLDLGEATKEKKNIAEKGTHIAANAARAERFGEKCPKDMAEPAAHGGASSRGQEADVGVEGQIRKRISKSHDERYGPVHWREIFREGRWVWLENIEQACN